LQVDNKGASSLQTIVSMNKLIHKLLILLVILYSVNSFAEKKDKEVRVELSDPQGEIVNVALTSSYNEFGVLEVRVDLAGMPKLLDRFNPTIAFGRDLDDNKKIDTWFFITKSGIEVEHIEGADPLGKDILPALILKKHQTTARLYVTTATTTLMGFLLLTANEAINKESSYIRDWINLDEMKFRLEREISSPSNTLTRDQIRLQYNFISSGYKFLADDMEHFAKVNFWEWAGADVALWISGSFLFKQAAGILLKAGSYITKTTVYLAFKDELNTLVVKNISALKERSEKMAPKKRGEKSESIAEENSTTLELEMSTFRLRHTLSETIKASIAKDKLTKVVAASLQSPLKMVAGTKSEWQYIAMSSGIQLSAETFAHYQEVYDPNELIMARNVLTNKDILQNIAFMTTDSILMTGISKDPTNMKARFLVSGFLGMHNSAMINLVIKNEDHYKRVALVTAWESYIGNAQVQLDLKALEKFEKMARFKNNPKIKLLGYAVVLVDQGAPTVKLVPILAEHY